MPFAWSGPVQLYYEDTGIGTPILFAHEMASDAQQWAAQTAVLQRRFRCVAYNARGYPPSDIPADEAAFAWTCFVADIGAVMDHLGLEAAYLVGCSMGAYAALVFALLHPERVKGVVAAGVGTGSPEDAIDIFRGDMRALSEIYETEGARPGAERILAGPNRTALKRNDPKAFAEFTAALEAHSAAGMAKVSRNYQGQRPSLMTFADDFRAMATPVLLAVGEEDSPCLATNEVLVDLIPKARLWTAPGRGHTLNLEEPDAFTRAVEDFIGLAERGAWVREG